LVPKTNWREPTCAPPTLVIVVVVVSAAVTVVDAVTAIYFVAQQFSDPHLQCFAAFCGMRCFAAFCGVF